MAAKHATIDIHYPDLEQGARFMILKPDKDTVGGPVCMLPTGFKREHRFG